MIAAAPRSLLRHASLLAAVTLVSCTAEPTRQAPNLAAKPANQLVASGNACGPTALINSFRFADRNWQRAIQKLDGNSDTAQVHIIIREYGMRPSHHLKNRPRWSRKGISIADLCDVGNELTHGHFLPPLQQEVLFVNPGEATSKLFARVHQKLNTSLAKGFPPTLSLRRYVHRSGQWTILDAHFVTLLALPRKLPNHATSYPVTYLDPWGGKIYQGAISLPQRPILAKDATASPCLEAVFPHAAVGRKLVKSGETSTLVLSAALGRW